MNLSFPICHLVFISDSAAAVICAVFSGVVVWLGIIRPALQQMKNDKRQITNDKCRDQRSP